MKTIATILFAGFLASTAAGCTTTEQHGAVVGGATGALIGGLATGRVGGALVGGAIGAGTGVLLADHSYSCKKYSPVTHHSYWGRCYR